MGHIDSDEGDGLLKEKTMDLERRTGVQSEMTVWPGRT